MSKTVMIPKIGANPYVVELNGVRYSYPAGTQQTVPDAVAAIIANDVAMRPKEDPNAGADTPAAIRAALEALRGRVDEIGPGSVIVPFTVTVSEGGEISVSTTANFSDVKSAVVAGKNVIAAVALDGGISVFAALSSKSPAADPTVLTFSLAVDIGDETAAPQLMQIGFAANEVRATVVDLAVAE